MLSASLELSPPMLAVLAFVFGSIVGSFLNVVILRVPAGESLLRPGSRCPSCGGPIPAWANVPIVSWLLLRGRCHRCRSRISLRYPLIEATSGVLFLALYLEWGLSVRLCALWLVGAALIAAAFIDGEHHIIPNSITLPGIPLGLAFAWISPPPGLLDALLGLVVVGGMLWALAAIYEWRTGRTGLGMGDVKLMAMLGAFLGLQPALGVLLVGSVLGLAQALLVLWLRGGGRKTPIPFGPALAAAGILHLYAPGLVSGLTLL
jgi:leader peptidase (prepilin peptidase)/N-methyltransferase